MFQERVKIEDLVAKGYQFGLTGEEGRVQGYVGQVGSIPLWIQAPSDAGKTRKQAINISISTGRTRHSIPLGKFWEFMRDVLGLGEGDFVCDCSAGPGWASDLAQLAKIDRVDFAAPDAAQQLTQAVAKNAALEREMAQIKADLAAWRASQPVTPGTVTPT